MKPIFLAVFLTLTSFTLSFSQQMNGGVRGSVLDENNTPVGFATVVLFTANDSTSYKAGYTLDDGTYEFPSILPGNYYLQVVLVGYKTTTTESFTIADQIVDRPSISLASNITELGEVVVTTTKPIIEVKPDKTVFNVEGSSVATGNDALELLRKAPGVVVDNNEQLMLIGKAGVRVFIDGKQSILSGADLAAYLKTIQASQIEAIEIITQPSSRYEADGNAGIINIRLIKDKSLGTNATVSANYNQGIHGRGNINTNINHRTKAMILYGNVNYATGTNSNWQHFQRFMPDYYVNQRNLGIDTWNNGNIRAGVDVNTGKNSTVGVLVNGGLNGWKGRTSVHTNIHNSPSEPVANILEGTNAMDNRRDNYNLNANYRFDNKQGKVFNVDVDYGAFINDGTSYQPNQYFDPETGMPTENRIYTANTPTNIKISTFKADYEVPIFKGVFGIGTKLALVNTDNNYEFFRVLDNGPVLDIDVSNRFNYSENVNAGYINWNRQWAKVGLQLGVRMEQTNSKGELTSYKPIDDEVVKRHYLDFFPSGGITYQLNDKNSLRLNYSRRIDRPSYQDLNPFEFRLDELTYSKGNPFLRPQYSNSASISHTYKYTLNTTFTYSHVADLMAELVDTAANGAAYQTNENIAEQDVFSLSVSYPFAISKAWNVFANANFSHTMNRADFGDGKIVDLSANNFNFYAQNTIALPKGFTFELSGWYSSPGIWAGTFKTKSMWSLDAGIQKKILANKGTVKLAISDIFKAMEWGGSSILGVLSTQAGGGWESRQVRLNFTYLLGNQNVAANRKRSTGLEDESNRVKSQSGN